MVHRTITIIPLYHHTRSFALTIIRSFGFL
jgi:hypothetical protein